ncbi:hypothetical protein BKK51_07270 [Rodentibacter trehalosifermentans]|uniref:Uncharacterized protein n=1 Tax=Rodentibacter trehalosifermentans TaxID=1908263 RepID=A0A1V3IT91_9PAST|nr:hypothetical protein [Rodentibacter trehalosifermentans]OOF45154.1 hypothetical protein BKK51_07270 [Rodentibacter trehalosifermentans]OOF48913.1 hypothetical protein BKK52_04930 [Rodentibacter trehalosifermentans]
MKHPELIVCAAIKFQLMNDYDIRYLVIPATRHYSPDMNAIIDTLEFNFSTIEESQGFITNFGRFVSRKEALEIAKANNQIRFDIGYEPDELYSEMLY